MAIFVGQRRRAVSPVVSGKPQHFPVGQGHRPGASHNLRAKRDHPLAHWCWSRLFCPTAAGRSRTSASRGVLGGMVGVGDDNQFPLWPGRGEPGADRSMLTIGVGGRDPDGLQCRPVSRAARTSRSAGEPHVRVNLAGRTVPPSRLDLGAVPGVLHEAITREADGTTGRIRARPWRWAGRSARTARRRACRSVP